MLKVLIRQRHGLGDAVQLTVVIKHLRHYHPDWKIDIEISRGKHSCFYGLCDRVFITNEEPSREFYDKIYNLVWSECSQSYSNLPCTKITKCLKEVFNLDPIPSLFTYQIKIGSEAMKITKQYLNNIPKNQGYIIIHYQGNSSCNSKNLNHDDIRSLCEYLINNDYTPIILDWDERSPIPNQKNIFCPNSSSFLWKNTKIGDAEIIASLIEQATLFIGIDSGPLHIAGSTNTPTIGIWTRHHPINFFDLCQNVLHLLPHDSRKNIRGNDKKNPFIYFEKAYKHIYYENLKAGLVDAIKTTLILKYTFQDIKWYPKTKKYEEKYYLENKLVGLDFSVYGDWQKKYSKWLTDSMNLTNNAVLDVGCACGAITKGFAEANAIACGIDINEYCINLGREKWPEISIYTCDAINLHIFENKVFNFIHLMHTIEHIKPEMIPFVLYELNRVSKIDAVLFCVLETEELLAKQGKKKDLPCIKSINWWANRLSSAGWIDCKTNYLQDLNCHDSYFNMYDWDWLCFKKIRNL